MLGGMLIRSLECCLDTFVNHCKTIPDVCLDLFGCMDRKSSMVVSLRAWNSVVNCSPATPFLRTYHEIITALTTLLLEAMPDASESAL